MKKTILLLSIALLNIKHITSFSNSKSDQVIRRTTIENCNHFTGLSTDNNPSVFANLQVLLSFASKQSLPQKFSKINIICKHKPNYAFLSFEITGNDHRSKNYTFTTTANNLNQTNITVFDSLDKDQYSFLSDITREKLEILKSTILQTSKFSDKEKFTICSIALGESPGEIIFEQPNNLTIKPC